jgi:hypothetical protein
MAIAAMEMPIAMNRFGLPGVEISVFCGSAFMISEIFQRTYNDCQADVGDGFGD